MKNPTYLEDAFADICKELIETFVKKYKDYGKGNILEIGELGIAFRINEKISRLKNLLMTKKKPQFESTDETWRDIAVYAIIAVLYERGWFQKLDMKEEKSQ